MKIIDGAVQQADDAIHAHLHQAQWLLTNSTTRIDPKQPPQPCYIGTIIDVISNKK
jgi:hypothetical protein